MTLAERLEALCAAIAAAHHAHDIESVRALADDIWQDGFLIGRADLPRRSPFVHDGKTEPPPPPPDTEPTNERPQQ